MLMASSGFDPSAGGLARTTTEILAFSALNWVAMAATSSPRRPQPTADPRSGPLRSGEIISVIDSIAARLPAQRRERGRKPQGRPTMLCVRNRSLALGAGMRLKGALLSHVALRKTGGVNDGISSSSSSSRRFASVNAADASFAGGRNRSCGIVGMPNVGKSTLFNALTNTQNAEAANYPFCTIKPNVGLVSVPDERLGKLAAMAKSKKVIGAQLEFVDIAGLVRGASEGAGLGNEFLSNIRQVSVIMQLLRCFDDHEDNPITHVDGSVDAVRDMETIETELLLADIQTLTRRMERSGAGKKGDALSSGGGKALMGRVLEELNEGRPARKMAIEEEEVGMFRELQLLTGKPMLYVCNVGESEAAEGNEHTGKVQEAVSSKGGNDSVLIVSCKLEEEVSQMSDDESAKGEMLQAYGLQETGLARIIKESNGLLRLATYYTVGPQEARAWVFPEGMRAPQAAGLIHSDFERGFIRANTMSYEDFVKYGGEAGCKDAGRMRQEGKDYVCCDGDIYHFLNNT